MAATIIAFSLFITAVAAGELIMFVSNKSLVYTSNDMMALDGSTNFGGWVSNWYQWKMFNLKIVYM